MRVRGRAQRIGVARKTVYEINPKSYFKQQGCDYPSSTIIVFSLVVFHLKSASVKPIMAKFSPWLILALEL